MPQVQDSNLPRCESLGMCFANLVLVSLPQVLPQARFPGLYQGHSLCLGRWRQSVLPLREPQGLPDLPLVPPAPAWTPTVSERRQVAFPAAR